MENKISSVSMWDIITLLALLLAAGGLWYGYCWLQNEKNIMVVTGGVLINDTLNQKLTSTSPITTTQATTIAATTTIANATTTTTTSTTSTTTTIFTLRGCAAECVNAHYSGGSCALLHSCLAMENLGYHWLPQADSTCSSGMVCCCFLN